VSLHRILVGFKIAGPSWLKDLKQPFWLIASGLCYYVVHSQTAVYDVFIVSIRATSDILSRYTTLLRPKYIVIKSNIVGYELDLKSPDFQTLMGTNAERVTAGKGVDRKQKVIL